MEGTDLPPCEHAALIMAMITTASATALRLGFMSRSFPSWDGLIEVGRVRRAVLCSGGDLEPPSPCDERGVGNEVPRVEPDEREVRGRSAGRCGLRRR